MLLIRLPEEGERATLTCKALKCLAYARRVFLCLLGLLRSPGWDCPEQSSGGRGGRAAVVVCQGDGLEGYRGMWQGEGWESAAASCRADPRAAT